MECDFGNAMVSLPQSWNWLENRRSEDEKVPRRMQKVVETKTEKSGVAKTKGKSREKTRRKGTEERKKDGSKKSSKRIGNLRWKEKSSKIRSRSKEIGSRKFS